jgi:large subunit ribosomal protein L9
MEVILLRDVEKVGRRGEVVQVRDGFGRNFLLPRALAVPANEKNRSVLETEKKHAVKRRALEKEEAAKLVERIKKISIRLEVKTGETGKLFGSVTAQDLAEALKAQGIAVDKKQIHLPEPIRALGIHSVTVELDPEVKIALQVEIVSKEKK